MSPFRTRPNVAAGSLARCTTARAWRRSRIWRSPSNALLRSSSPSTTLSCLALRRLEGDTLLSRRGNQDLSFFEAANDLAGHLVLDLPYTVVRSKKADGQLHPVFRNPPEHPWIDVTGIDPEPCFKPAYLFLAHALRGPCLAIGCVE